MAISQIVTNSIANNVSVTFTAGSAAAPAVTTTGDTNTGMFFPAADTIAFAEGGAEVARFDSSGRLGLGTSSPDEKLTVTTSGSNVYTKTTDGTVNLYVGITNSSATAINGTISNHPYAFFTNNSERMRIDSSGNLLVGCTTSPSSSVAGFSISNNGGQPFVNYSNNGTGTSTLCVFLNANGAVGTIRTSGSSTAYNTSSDYRLKENIAPMTGALNIVQALKPVTYNWKVDSSSGQGFIAHELEAVVPDCVTGEKDAVDAEGNIQPQAIDTSFLVATLTAAIQEQQAIITEQASTIAAMEARLIALELK